MHDWCFFINFFVSKNRTKNFTSDWNDWFNYIFTFDNYWIFYCQRRSLDKYWTNFSWIILIYVYLWSFSRWNYMALYCWNSVTINCFYSYNDHMVICSFDCCFIPNYKEDITWWESCIFILIFLDMDFYFFNFRSIHLNRNKRKNITSNSIRI